MAQDRVFDTSAVIAFLKDEPGADAVDHMILEAQKSGAALLITSVNLGEVWYSIARIRADADATVIHLGSLGFVTVDVNWEIARQAAMYKFKYKLSYNDCCAAALAKLRKVQLVTCDYDYKALEREVKLRWLQAH